MADVVSNITLSSSRDIPFNKPVLSQANVRRVKAGISIEALAADAAAEPQRPPGWRWRWLRNWRLRGARRRRHYRALELLVRQKRLAEDAFVPCVVRDASSGISAEEDPLAENAQRADLHPLNQFRAFKALSDQGLGEEVRWPP